MKLKLTCLFMGLLPLCNLLGQASLSGHVSNAISGEPVLFGNVKLYQNGVYQTGVQTDFDGNYSFSPIDPGVYSVETSYVGFKTNRVEEVNVNSGRENALNISMVKGSSSDDIVIIDYKVPLIDHNNTHNEGMTTTQIKTLPTKEIKAITSSVSGSDGIYFLPAIDDRFLSLMFTIRFDNVMLLSAEDKIVKRLRFKKIGEHQLRINKLTPGEYTIVGFAKGVEFRLPFQVTED